MCHTASYYYVGKDPTYAFGTAVPFGLNSRMQNAWQYFGGGLELMNDFYKKATSTRIPCGNTGCQMGGWFRKEIKEPGDLNGPEDAHRRLRRPRADQARRSCRSRSPAATSIRRWRRARSMPAEWVGPYDDEKLGFQKVAQYYYYPGWWEGGAMLHNFINIEKWNALLADLQVDRQDRLDGGARVDAGEVRCGQSGGAQAAGRRPARSCARSRPPVMDACLKASLELYAEVSATNADFKKIWESTLASATTSICGGRSPNTPTTPS